MKEEYRELLWERMTSKQEQGKPGKKNRDRVVNKNGEVVVDRLTPSKLIKSPSDMTIYTPALAQMPEKRVGSQLGSEYIDNIANFVEHMRLQQAHKEKEDQMASGLSNDKRGQNSKQDGPLANEGVSAAKDDRRNEMRTEADKLITDAELFRVNIEQPKGEQIHFDREKLFGHSDDDFFHLICYVDSSLVEKIKKGQYVELEKLLPGDKYKKENTRLEWCIRDGATYLAPAEKDKKITNVRRWDQVFRIYASIYCRANPDRAGEIWQYIEVMHTAAAAYIWDNVAKYDYVFRQLMEFNPKRSWAITYGHMWNLTLVEPLPKHYQNNSSGNVGAGFKRMGETKKLSNTAAGNRNSQNSNQKKKNGRYCWGLNGKGNHCHFGDSCKFINKCSYCDSTHHGITKCPKLLKGKQEEATQSRSIIIRIYPIENFKITSLIFLQKKSWIGLKILI